MSWVTVLWSMIATACLTLALVHGLVWWWRREAWANLLFALSSVATAFFAAGEMWIMRAATPEQFATAVRWTHVPVLVLVLSLVGFVRLYLRAGRPWLAWTACAARVLSLVLDFLTGVNLNYREITALRRVPLLGEPVSVAVGVPNPWMLVGHLSSLALVLFVADASFAVWRMGDRRKALLVGGSITFFVLAGQVHSLLVFWGILQGPILVCVFFMAIVAAMGFELSRDMFHAADLARDLRESEQRMTLAAEAADLGLWVWEIPRDVLWMSDSGRELLGFGSEERLDFASIVRKVHPEDRGPVRAAVDAALANGGEYRAEYRVTPSSAPTRWIAGRGRVERSADGRPLRLRGISIDITQRKHAELEMVRQRGELAHLSRVAMLGELSGSMAHELNQPLTAILSNAQAAQRYLARDIPDLAELKEILADIVTQDERAGEVIRRLHLLLKKGEFQKQVLDANDVVLEVLKLLRGDLANHGVTVETRLAIGLTPLHGDRVQLQQVLLNLIMNASDAMAENAANDRRITVRTLPDGPAGLRIEVSDVGRGLPPGEPDLAFERFFTTKLHGLGLGLSVCRTIITAHGGSLGAVNNPGRGATFHCLLPLPAEAHP